jgi:hypothetical protein
MKMQLARLTSAIEIFVARLFFSAPAAAAGSIIVKFGFLFYLIFSPEIAPSIRWTTSSEREKIAQPVDRFALITTYTYLIAPAEYFVFCYFFEWIFAQLVIL